MTWMLAREVASDKVLCVDIATVSINTEQQHNHGPTMIQQKLRYICFLSFKCVDIEGEERDLPQKYAQESIWLAILLREDIDTTHPIKYNWTNVKQVIPPPRGPVMMINTCQQCNNKALTVLIISWAGGNEEIQHATRADFPMLWHIFWQKKELDTISIDCRMRFVRK